MKISMIPNYCQQLVLLLTLIFVILVFVGSGILLQLICTFLLTSDAECLFSVFLPPMYLSGAVDAG